MLLDGDQLGGIAEYFAAHVGISIACSRIECTLARPRPGLDDCGHSALIVRSACRKRYRDEAVALA